VATGDEYQAELGEPIQIIDSTRSIRSAFRDRERRADERSTTYTS
jgi:hypothetical protein